MFNLEEFRQGVSHKTEIRESDRGSYVVFDYVVALKDTFDNQYARNARGIAFDKSSGHVISLPYAKFHNYNECDGWREQDIDLSEPHAILEKLDGSMIRTIRDDSDLGFHFGTRAGVTDVSVKATKYLLEGMADSLLGSYLRFIYSTLKNNTTAIFEYCAPDNRIVVYYSQPQLILTAIRKNETGEYMKYEQMVEKAETYGVPVVQRVSSEHSSIGDLADRVKEFVGSEGVVVRFESGKMVKMKGLDYVQKHKALDGLRHEKDVLVLIFNNLLDDALPLVDDLTRDRLVAFREDVLRNVRNFMDGMKAEFQRLKTQCGEDRKLFSEEAKKHKRHDILMALLGPKVTPQRPLPAHYKPFSIVAYIVGDKWVIGNLKTQKEVDEIRDIIGPKSWYEYGVKINTGDE